MAVRDRLRQFPEMATKKRDDDLFAGKGGPKAEAGYTAASIEVLDAISLEVDDNLAVGALDPHKLPEIARDLKHEGADAIILSACVQMPSLPAVQTVEDELGLPVITAATATTYEILKALGHTPSITGAGGLLSGAYTAAAAGRG